MGCAVGLAMVMSLLLDACERADARHDLDEALACTVDAIAVASADDEALVPGVLDTLEATAPPGVVIHAARAMATRFTRAPELANVADALAAEHEGAAAGQTAQHAVELSAGLPREQRAATFAFAALAFAWAGDPGAGELLELDDLGRLALAEGEAHAGDRERASELLARETAVAPQEARPTTWRAERATVLVLLGRLAEARAVVAEEPEPVMRLYILDRIANAAIEAHDAECERVLDEAVAVAASQAEHPARTDDRPMILEEQIAYANLYARAGALAKSARLRAQIVAHVDPRSTGALAKLALDAQLAGAPAEADALLARLVSVPADTRAMLHALRGQLAAALAALHEAREHRAETLLFLWSRLATAPDEPALAAQLRTAACRK